MTDKDWVNSRRWNAVEMTVKIAPEWVPVLDKIMKAERLDSIQAVVEKAVEAMIKGYTRSVFELEK